MKEQLILLAKENNFESTFLYNEPMKYSLKEELRWLFWMTELQQWLRNYHQIHINIGDVSGFLGIKGFVFEISTLHKKEILLHSKYPWGNSTKEDVFQTFEQCLKYSLIQALNLIKPKEQ